jgi:hypothetical protein
MGLRYRVSGPQEIALNFPVVLLYLLHTMRDTGYSMKNLQEEKARRMSFERDHSVRPSGKDNFRCTILTQLDSSHVVDYYLGSLID